MCTVILQVNREGKTRAKRKAECIVGSHCGQRVYIGNLNIKHHDLVAERSTLFDQQRNFAVFVIRPDRFFVDNLDYWTCRLLVFVLLR